MPGATSSATCTVERCWQVGLLLGAEELRVRRREATQFMRPDFGGIADQIHGHRDHVLESQAEQIQRFLDSAEGTEGLRLRVAPVFRESLRLPWDRGARE